MTSSNVDNFNQWYNGVKAWINGVPAEAKKFHASRLLYATELILAFTPVDTGRTLGEWQISAYFPKTKMVGRIRSIDEVLAEARSVASSMRPFTRTWIVNNLRHIQILEHGLFNPKNPGPSKDRRPHRFGKVWVIGGFSVQAPKGILKPALEILNSGVGSPVKSRDAEV